MNDIFISYASPDRAVAQQLADALQALGWSVWWDREIPLGKAFDQVIEEELNAARCVIVLWTKDSVHSHWVKSEAAAAADRDRLVPALIQDVPIPLEFNRIQTAMLQGWRADRTHPEFIRLVNSVRQMLGEPPAPQPAARGEAGRTSKLHLSTRAKLAIVAAGLIVTFATVLIGKNVFHSGESAPPQTASNKPLPSQARQTISPSTSALSASSGAAPMVKGAFAIKIGDRIGDGVPVPGAGNVEAPGAKNIYTFAAAPGQRVYFRMLEHAKGMAQVKWKLTDPDGTEVFDTCLGCTEPGVQTMRKGGTYTLVVGSDRDPGVGAYRLQLYSVPSPNQFSIKVGDPIKENVPGPGAGVIESPGARDVYKFAASPGQRIYFRMLGHDNGMAQVKWKLTDSDGTEVFDTCLGCTEPGVQTMRKGGTYTLVVGSDRDPGVGAYRLQLYSVPSPNQFSIKVGDPIKENVPGPGAGNIESPGAADIYTFSVAAGQRVYFRMLEHERGMAQVKWKLTDSDGTEVFDTCLGCSEPGVQTLRKGGTYTLVVGSDRDPGVGAYRLQLSTSGG